MTAPIKGITDEAREEAISKNLSAATDAFGVTDGEKAYAARNKVRDQGARDQAAFDASETQRRRGASPAAAKLTRTPTEPFAQQTTGESFSPQQLAGKVQA